MAKPRLARWSWWCIDGLTKKTVCLHVQYGLKEYEARFDVDLRHYQDNIVRVVRAPVTEHDFREVRWGVWNEIADKMETWPKLAGIISDLERYVLQQTDLSPPTVGKEETGSELLRDQLKDGVSDAAAKPE